MKFPPSATACRSVSLACSRSGGSPQMPSPVIRMASNPSRFTVRYCLPAGSGGFSRSVLMRQAAAPGHAPDLGRRALWTSPDAGCGCAAPGARREAPHAPQQRGGRENPHPGCISVASPRCGARGGVARRPCGGRGEGGGARQRGGGGAGAGRTTDPPPVQRERVEEAIEDACRREAEVDARHVRVEVSDPPARLYGHVHSLKEASAARAAAAAAPGVAMVESHLLISP